MMLLFLTPQSFALAQDTGSPITVEPIYPDNQVKGINGYFRLLVQPNDTQTVKVKVTNNLEEELTITMQPANAFTNPTGEMLYSDTIDSDNAILLDDAVKMAPHLKVESKITLGSKETKEIPIEISVPDQDAGTLLGAIRFIITGQPVDDQSEANKDESSFILKTETVYSVAVQLDLPNSTNPNFSLGKAGFNSLGPNVYIEMKNDAQLIQHDISGNYEVQDSNGNPLFEGEINTFKMAPKSQIRYPMQWNSETLAQGKYKLIVNINVNDDEITAEEEFEIGNDQIEEYAERTQPEIQLEEEGIPIWVWLIVGAVILAGLMFWLGSRKR